MQEGLDAEPRSMPVFLGVDHVDARVPSLTAVEAFYDRLMPELGLTQKKHSHVDAAGDWHGVDHAHAANVAEYYEEAPPDGAARFIGIIEDVSMSVVRTRIAFRVESRAELEAWEPKLRACGARGIDRSADMDAYPAIFFEDPVGTKLEICARDPR
jgi:catechol 2,3-dioxygenase-like lactoylglutathione lyase family enzyme